MTYAELNKYPLSGWFPGHMLRAGKQMQESLRLVDLLVELLDARAPLSSRNPELLEGLRQKPRILLANKADLADAAVSRQWAAYFAAAGESVTFVDSRRLGNVRGLLQEWRGLIESGARVPPLRGLCALWFWASPMWASPPWLTVYIGATRRRWGLSPG